jgi:hypothetical protein
MMNSYSPLAFTAIGSMRAGDLHLRGSLLQKSEIEKRVDHHPRAAGKYATFLETKKLLIEVAKPFGVLRDKRDMPEFPHGTASPIT